MTTVTRSQTGTRRVSRGRKLRAIGQAHLAPGMTLLRRDAILTEHNCAHLRTWDGVEDSVIDAIITDIAAIVRAAQERNDQHDDKPHDDS